MNKISDLQAVSTLALTDLLPVVQTPDSATGTKSATVQKMVDLPIVNGGKVIYVDATNGNDSSAARGTRRAFLTLAAAKTAALSGDLIVVMPGEYTALNLLKNGVNWHFIEGAIVTRTEQDAPGAIFDDGTDGANAAIVCSISGRGEFRHEDALVTNFGYAGAGDNIGGGFILYTENPGTRIHFECKRIYGTGDSTAAVFSLFVKNCDRVYVDCDEMDLEYNGLLGNAFWLKGEFHLNSRYIGGGLNSGSNGGTYSLWSVEPVGGADANWYVNCDILENRTYSAIAFEATTNAYKMWIRAIEIRSVNDGQLLGGVDPVNTAAIECYGGGKLYIEAQKILSKNPPGSRGGPVVNQTGGELWLRAMKCTHESTENQSGGKPLFVQQSAGTAFYDVHHWEHVGNFSGDGFAISGGTADFRGGVCEAKNGKAIVHSGGVSRWHSMRVVTSNTNSAGNNPAYVSASGLTLDNCVLIAPALAASIDAPSAQNVLATVSFSNKGINGATVTIVGAGIFADDPSWS